MFVQQTLEESPSEIEGKFAYLSYNNVVLQGKGQAGLLAANYKRFNFPKLRFFTCDIKIVKCIFIISSRSL